MRSDQIVKVAAAPILKKGFAASSIIGQPGMQILKKGLLNSMNSELGTPSLQPQKSLIPKGPIKLMKSSLLGVDSTPQ